MWHCSAVEKFLADQNVEPAALEAVKLRMAKFADKDGQIATLLLDHVVGNATLARAFEKAWEEDPSIARPSYS